MHIKCTRIIHFVCATSLFVYRSVVPSTYINSYNNISIFHSPNSKNTNFLGSVLKFHQYLISKCYAYVFGTCVFSIPKKAFTVILTKPLNFTLFAHKNAYKTGSFLIFQVCWQFVQIYLEKIKIGLRH